MTPRASMLKAWHDYLAVRKAGQRDRVKLLVVIAETRKWLKSGGKVMP